MLSKYNVNTKSILVKKKISRLQIYGPALAECRVKAGLTQEELASELGITRVTLTGWESKTAVIITEKQAERLETLLKITRDVLTKVPHETNEPYILDHPLIKAMVDQSKYIMERVRDLEDENKRLRGDKDN